MRSARSAFTLIELLLVISCIAVLSTLAVGVMASAQDDARLAATRSRIQIIQLAMEIELEDYEVRRSPVPLQQIVNLAAAVYSTNSPSRLQVKNLKRMIVADLIRSEFPNGEQPVGSLGSFPSPTLEQFLGAGATDFQPKPANVNRWSSIKDVGDPLGDASNPLAPSDAANNSEYLYEILRGLDFGGTTVLDRLGPRAVGNTDNDSRPEIIDGFGDPIYFQFHQRNLVVDDANTGTWQQGTPEMATFKEAKPVLPTELRFFLSSENLFEIDGLPVDLE